MDTNAPPPRRKSCSNCSKSKVRCDLGRPSCSRCQHRGLDCVYIGARAAHEYPTPASVEQNRHHGAAEGSIVSPLNSPNTEVPYNDLPRTTVAIPLDTNPEQTETLNFDNIELVSTVDEHRIRARWLDTLLPSLGQLPKPYTAATMKFVSTVLSSYPSIFLDDGELPPFIHWAQMKASTCGPLVNCINLARMWTTQAAGTAGMVREIIEREMEKLIDQRPLCSHFELLATLQAYLLYAIMLFFTRPCLSEFTVQDVVIKLQDMAGDIASKGTVCLGEANGFRPDWESWIIASAKRRTLFAAYLFDHLVNFSTGTPSFIATELASLPAPGSKRLWNANTRNTWQTAYNKHLSDWPEGDLLISELWPQTEASFSRQRRIERWTSSVDEFGMMIYAVTSHTYDG